jgi:hypothetical protein
MITDEQFAKLAMRADDLEGQAEQTAELALGQVLALMAISARLELLTEVLRDRPTEDSHD